MWCCCRSIVKLHFTSVDVTVDKVEWRLFLWDNLWYFLLYFFCLYFYGYFGRMLFFVYISSGATSSPFPTLRSLPFSSLSKQMHLGLFHMNASLISKCNFYPPGLNLAKTYNFSNGLVQVNRLPFKIFRVRANTGPAVGGGVLSNVMSSNLLFSTGRNSTL